MAMLNNQRVSHRIGFLGILWENLQEKPHGKNSMVSGEDFPEKNKPLI